MRKLKTSDVFSGMRAINAAGAQEEVKRIAALVQNNKNISVSNVGVEFIVNLICSASSSKAEKAIYEFLSGPLEVKPEAIAELDPLELMDKLKELKEYIDIDGWKAFFKSLSALMR